MFKSVLSEVNSSLLRIKFIGQPVCHLRDKTTKKASNKDKNGRNVLEQWLDESEEFKRKEALKNETRKKIIESIYSSLEQCNESENGSIEQVKSRSTEKDKKDKES